MKIQTSGIYVHIPFCKQRCHYCDFVSFDDCKNADEYFLALAKEIALTPVSDNTSVQTVFLGGGTPTVASTQNLNMLFSALRKKFNFSSVTEITCEANPESLSADKLDCLQANGVNRLSIGLQSTNDNTLKTIGRIHTFNQFENALNLAVQKGFDNINADLIVGLPESSESFRRSVQQASCLPLSHVSVYALEVHPGTKLFNYRRINGDWTTEDSTVDDYDYACETLQKHGFLRYEVSNFAKSGKQCKHNLNYWQAGGYYGFGVSAHGFVDGVRYNNTAFLQHYFDKLAGGKLPIEHAQPPYTVSEEKYDYVMLGLRLENGVNLAEYKRRFFADFFDDYPSATSLLAQGFLQMQNDNIFVAPTKFYVLNSILAELL